MKVRYFTDTDTLWIELRQSEIAETRDLDENTLADLDANGSICSSPSSMHLNALTFRASRSNTSRRRPATVA